jgi:hypothetical protein
MSPEQKEWARKAYPRFYEQRLQDLRANVALAGQIAEDKLLGIRDKDSMLRTYAVQSGFIPADPLENILHPERSAQVRQSAERQAAYRRGLLNPRRLIHGDAGTASRATNALTLTGKSGNALGPNPAYLLGTTVNGQQHGFTSVGPITPQQERNDSQFRTQLNNLRL